MPKICVKTPAKINITLEITGKRPDGFHNIKSIMQTVNLYDIVSIELKDIGEKTNIIEISGNNQEIPYDKRNIAYSACEKYLQKANITGKKVSIYIEKHIPVSAGLAGGSSNAAGVLFGLNKLLNKLLSKGEIDEIAASLGSDINFCLYGGAQVATSRGEIVEKTALPELKIVIVKPKAIGISAAEAYKKYALLKNKPIPQNTDLILNNPSEKNIVKLLRNDLELGILEDYSIISEIKEKLVKAGCSVSIMSGSGSSVFGIYFVGVDLSCFNENFDVFEVKTVPHGVVEL